jgi:hypothetical protein
MGVETGQDAAGVDGLNDGPGMGEVLRGAGRGAVGAMAMTGMRVLTTELGLVDQTPPAAVSRQRARGLRALLRRAPRKQRRGLVEIRRRQPAACWTGRAGRRSSVSPARS